MTGLVLEGGGGKGAFHIGVIKALIEDGYTFDVAAGTSVGAMNAALIVQNDFELAFKCWESLDSSAVLGLNSENDGSIVQVGEAMSQFFSNRGLDTSKIRKILEDMIDEKKVRESKIDFGLVTISLTQRKPLELYKEDIPEGKLIDYIMASASVPVFRIEPLDGNIYIDGSFYNNCPVNLLADKGCDKMIIVRTYPLRPLRYEPSEDVDAIIIKPTMQLGGLLDFGSETLKRNIAIGYCEGKRAIGKTLGNKYFIEKITKDEMYALLQRIPKERIKQICKIYFNTTGGDNGLFEYIIPEVSKILKMTEGDTLDIIISMLEHEAKKYRIERVKVYSLNEFAGILKRAKRNKPRHAIISRNERFISSFCTMVINSILES